MRLSHEGNDLAELTARIQHTYGPNVHIVKTERIRDGGVMGFFATERYRITIDVPQPAVSQGENMAAHSFARSEGQPPTPQRPLPEEPSPSRNENMLAALIEAAEHGDGHPGADVASVDDVATVRHYDSVQDGAEGVDPMFAHLLHTATAAQESAPRHPRSVPSPASRPAEDRGSFGYTGYSHHNPLAPASTFDELPNQGQPIPAKPARAAGYHSNTPDYTTTYGQDAADGAYTVAGGPTSPRADGYVTAHLGNTSSRDVEPHPTGLNTTTPRPAPSTYSHGEKLTSIPALRQTTATSRPGQGQHYADTEPTSNTARMSPRSTRRPEYPTGTGQMPQMPEMFSQYASDSRESGATSATSPVGEYAQIMAAAARPGNTGSRQSPRTEPTRPQQTPTSGRPGVTEFNPFGTAQPGRRPSRAPYQAGEHPPMGYERTAATHERAQAHYGDRGAASLSGRLRRHVRDRGLPAAMLDMLPEDAHLEDLLGLLKRLPRCEVPVPTPGFVAAVVGASAATTAVATRLGAFLGSGQLPVADTKVVTSSRQARAGAERIRTSDGVGAMAVSLRYENREAADAAATMLAVSAPDVVLLCIDAGRKRSDTLTFVSSLLQQGVTIDGLAVINARNTSEPATVLELGIGIWELDGAMADPLSWMPVLLSGFAE